MGSGEWQKYYELAKRDIRTFLWAAMKSLRTRRSQKMTPVKKGIHVHIILNVGIKVSIH